MPALFLCLAAPAALGGELALRYEQQGSGAPLEVRQWADQPLRTDPATVIAAARLSLAARLELGGVTLSLEQASRAYLRGNANVLALAAANERSGEVNLPPVGSYGLQGKFQFLRSTDLALQRRVALSPAWGLDVRGWLAQVHDYQRVQGSAALAVQDRNAALVGTVQRVGTRPFGFLVDDRPDRGHGLGLDLSLAYADGPWSARWDLDNAWSRLDFADLHFSDRQYNIATRDGKLVIRTRDDFSMTGRYGVGSRRESLMVHTRAGLAHADWPHWQAGLLSVGRDAAPWLQWQGGMGRWSCTAQTVALRNLTLGAAYVHERGVRLDAGITFSSAARASLAQVGMAWRW